MIKTDVIVTGVRQQEVEAFASILCHSAMRAGLHAAQMIRIGAELRPTSVTAHIRIAPTTPEASTIGLGEADLILGFEPLETKRALEHLSPAGSVVAAVEPIQDFAGYPDPTDVLWSLLNVPHLHLLDIKAVTRREPTAHSTGVVILGAALEHLPMTRDQLCEEIAGELVRLGPEGIKTALAEFSSGVAAARREIVDEFETFAGASR